MTASTAAGGPPDWAQVYAEHGPALRRAARRIVGADEDVLGKSGDDFVGDLFVDLIKAGSLPQVRNLRAYLITAVKNRVVDQLRRQRFEVHDDAAVAAMPAEDDPATIVEGRLLGAAAVGALDELPPRPRYVLEHRLMLRRPANEVAAELGIKPQGIPQLVATALARLRRLPTFIEASSFDSRMPSNDAGEEESDHSEQ